MFKVSFKETEDNPSKVVYKAGLRTTVILKGTVKIPPFFHRLPNDIMEWVAKQNHIELYEDISKGILIIHSEGIAKCRKEDKYDTVLGERIAESRAKSYIYTFFHKLCKKAFHYYDDITFRLMDDVKKYDGLKSHELEHLNTLLNSKENG